jgi:hypothetical protein
MTDPTYPAQPEFSLEPPDSPAQPPEILQPYAPEPVQEAAAEAPKRRGRPPKSASQPNEEAPAKSDKLVVQTRFPYAMPCSTQNILIRPGTWTEVDLDHWVKAQLDAGLLLIK